MVIVHRKPGAKCAKVLFFRTLKVGNSEKPYDFIVEVLLTLKIFIILRNSSAHRKGAKDAKKKRNSSATLDRMNRINMIIVSSCISFTLNP